MVVIMIVLMVVVCRPSRNAGSMSRIRSRSKALRPSTSAMAILARSVLVQPGIRIDAADARLDLG